jgi:hypothetical protein
VVRHLPGSVAFYHAGAIGAKASAAHIGWPEHAIDVKNDE